MAPTPISALIERFETLYWSGGVRIAVFFEEGDVLVPAYLKEKDHCILEYESSAIVPIPDLSVTPEGISATLSFGRTPYKTFVPWNCVLGMVSMSPAAGDSPRAPGKPSKAARHLKAVP